MGSYRQLEDLVVYQKLCQLHIAISERTHRWLEEEKNEPGSQARRSSNSAAAQLGEKYGVAMFGTKLRVSIAVEVRLQRPCITFILAI